MHPKAARATCEMDGTHSVVIAPHSAPGSAAEEARQLKAVGFA